MVSILAMHSHRILTQTKKYIMKNQIKSIGSALIAIVFLSATSFAAIPSDDKAVNKAKNAVEQASPDDWKTLEESARVCIKKGKNMKEAAEWINASIAIKATPSNLELKGDYYLKNNLPEKALQYYIQSSKSIKEQNANNSTFHLEEKIRSITQG